MKVKSLLLMMLLAFAAPWATPLWAEEIIIGTGTNTSTASGSNSGEGSPIANPYYYYGTAQFMYTSSEMGAAKTLGSIAFYHNAYSFVGTIKIYLTHTSNTELSTSNPFTLGTLVYTGTNITLGGSSAGWQTFDFDTPFEYNGTSNLVVIVCRQKNNSGSGSSYSSSLGWQYTECTTNYYISNKGNDNTTSYGEITSSSNYSVVSKLRPNVKFKTFDPEVTADGTKMSWNSFVNSVSGGNTYSGKTVYLNKDISISTMVGTDSNPFCGTFNGQGNTLTVDISSSDQGAAPFHNIGDGAIIENLKVTGTVSASAHHAGGLVGFVDKGAGGSVTAPQAIYTTIRNCRVSTNVSGGSNYIGGIIGHANVGRNTIEGCVYDGTLTSSGFKGGMIGWSNWSALTLTNSYFNGANSSGGTFDPVACKTQYYEGQTTETLINLTITNFYYNTDGGFGSDNLHWGLHGTSYASNWNKHARTVTLAANPTAGGTVSLGNSTNTYSVSGITAYSTGIKYNNTFYAGSGDQISVTATANAGYEFTEWSNGSTTSTNNPYTYTMTNANTTLTATFDELPIATVPYTDGFEGTNDWVFEGSTTNYWTVGTSQHNTGSKSLYITNNGSDYGYDNNTAAVAFASRLIHLDAGVYSFSYQWKCTGEGSTTRYDYMRAFLAPASATLTDASSSFGNTYTSTPTGWTTALDGGQCLNQSSSWQEKTVGYEVTTSGDYKIVFVWRNDGSSGSAPAAVDDISVTAVTIPYTIASASDWNDFCTAVNGGHSYANETVTMTADVTTAVTAIAGTSSSTPFSGTFNGQGHTLNVNITGSSQGTAPFQNISGATIKDLVITGSVTCSDYHGGGLVGFAADNTTNTINNCLVSTTVSVSRLGGGIIGHGKRATVNIVGCVFNGQIINTVYESDENRGVGGLVGWCDPANDDNSSFATLNITNTLFAGTYQRTYSGTTEMLFHPVAISAQPASGVTCTLNNVYYTFDQVGKDGTKINIVTNNGKHAYSITGNTGVTVAYAGTGTNYDVSGITSYGTGIKYNYNDNDVLYAGDGDQVSLTLNGANSYEADYGTLAESGNAYTLTMVASNTVISGVSCAVPTNLQCTYYTTNSATLEWTAGGDEEAWQVKCWPSNQQEPGDLEGYITNVSTNPSNPSYTLTNLTEDQTYHVKVRAKCDENDFSDWTSSIDVTPGRMTYYFVGGNNDNEWSTLANWSYFVGDVPYTATALPTINDNVQLMANVTIPSGYTATANAITNTDSNSNTYTITIADGGQLQHNNEHVMAVVEKEITGYTEANVNTNKGYHLISSPLVGSTSASGEGGFTNLVTDDYDLYSFNYANGDGLLEWVDMTGTDGTPSLDNTVGYLYARKTDAIITTPFEEILPSNTDKPVYLQYDGNGTYRFNGWNLVGNPFVCNAYVSGFEGEYDDEEGDYQPSSTAAQLSYYVLNHAADYDEFVVPQPLGAIAPMGAVMVQATAANQFAVFSRTAPASKGGSLNLNITGNATRGTIDRAVLAFGNTMPLGKFQLNPDHTKVYIPMDGNDYAVAKVEGAGAVPVNFKAEHSGRYTISVNAEEVSFNYLHLIDNMTGTDIDLLATPSYSFESRTTDYESRFRLVFATGDNSASESFAFFSNGTYVINNDGDATLQVIDLTGRVLSSEAIHGSVSKAIQAAPGIYMLRLINGNDVKVQKVVVR